MRVVIKKDTTSKKKMVAVFYEGDKKIRTDEQQKAYKARHKGDNLNDKFSAGALSMTVLWSSKSLAQGISNYKSKYGLK